LFQGRALFRIDKGRLLILPNEGRSVWLGTRVGAALKVSARETGDSFSAVELTITPGSIVVPHAHSREDEVTYVIEGEIGVKIGDQVVTAPSGSLRFQAQKCPSHFLESRDKGRTDTRDDSTARFCKLL